MVNIIYSPVLEYDHGIAERFDETRRKRLSADFKINKPRDEIFTSGVLIDMIRPEGAEIFYRDDGRPAFKISNDCAALRSFNVTHSGGFVFCAFSDEVEVGVDFESADRAISERISKRLCSGSELDYLGTLSPEDKRIFLLKLFTRKEAVSKLLGLGITMDFKNITDLGLLQNPDSDDFSSVTDIPGEKNDDTIDSLCLLRTIVIENGYLSTAIKYDADKAEDCYKLNIRRV